MRILGKGLFKESLPLLLAGGGIVASLELLWGQVFRRFPVYWLPTFHPLPALLLNGIIHIAGTALLAAVFGLPVLIVFRRRKIRTGIFLAAAALYVFYLGYTVFFRVIEMNEKISSGLHLTAVLTWSVFLAAGAFAWWFSTRSGRDADDNPAWPSTVIISAFIGSFAFAERWPRALWRFPPSSFWLLILGAAALLLAHLGLWYLTRRWRPSARFLGTVLAASTLVLLLLRGLCLEMGSAVNKPDLVLLLWDAARADRMRLSGQETCPLPFVASLLPRSLIFTRAHSTTNYTFGSHVSLFTGKYCREHGLWNSTLPELKDYCRFDLLPEKLRRKGYRTVMLTENPWVAPLNKGFDSYVWVDQRLPAIARTSRSFPPRFIGNCVTPFFLRQILDNLRYHREGLYKRVIDDYLFWRLEEELILLGRDRPLFVFINLMNPNNRTQPYRFFPVPGPSGGRSLDEILAEYDLALLRSDERFKELAAIFKRSGRFKRTLFVLTADHGETFREHRLRVGHYLSLYESELHVPLLFYHLGWPSGEMIDSPVSLARIKSALESAAEGGAADSILKREIVGKISRGGGVAAESRSPESSGNYFFKFAYLDNEGYKFIHDPSRGGEPVDSFFDLKRDPDESENLIGTRPAIYQRLLREYESWKAATPEARGRSGGSYPPGLERHLRALGYIQ